MAVNYQNELIGEVGVGGEGGFVKAEEGRTEKILKSMARRGKGQCWGTGRGERGGTHVIK